MAYAKKTVSVFLHPGLSLKFHMIPQRHKVLKRHMIRDSNKSPQKAPTPICAVADFIRKHCIPTGAFNKSTGQYPDTEFVQRKMECLRQYIPSLSMTFTVPQHRVTGQCPDPHYHSIEGTDLLIVFWEMHFKGIVLKCPCCDHGRLSCDGGKFASNNDLFPIFHLHKPPSWAMLMKYKCHSCKESMYANDGRLLANLPAFVRDAYPSNHFSQSMLLQGIARTPGFPFPAASGRSSSVPSSLVSFTWTAL